MTMITEGKARVFYQALLEKSQKYEGIFFVGVKTTGVFCRPTCSARKPKFENCEILLHLSIVVKLMSPTPDTYSWPFALLSINFAFLKQMSYDQNIYNIEC